MGNFSENEKKLLKAIQQFKDTAFGLESRYTSYCYEYIGGVRQLNEEKVEAFITELEELAKRSSFYTDALTSLIDKFLRVVIRYMDCTFAPYEYKFVSIRKIADTVYKQSLTQVSTFDILITDQKQKMDPYYYSLYENFTKDIVDADQSAFFRCIKTSLDAFVDEHQLNCLHDDQETAELVARINQYSRRLTSPARELPRRVKREDDE